MNFISLRHQIIKTANFLQGENTQIFLDKFSDKDPGVVKSLADRAYHLFKAWKDYDGYRALLTSISGWEEMEMFVKKCEEKLSSLTGLVVGFGFPVAVADDMSRQYIHKYVKDLDSPDFLGRVSSVGNKADFIALLKGEKKAKDALIPELNGKDLSSLGADHIAWIAKIIQSSKMGGEAHSADDIISLAKTFRRMEESFDKKIGQFDTYSQLSKFIDDQSFDNKAAYVSSIKDAATSDDMSKVIYEDPRWKVVLIGSTIGGQWWGRDTSFCISTLEGNLYSSYALNENIDPYFIIDKEADSSNEMRKFTVAIKYAEGKPELTLDNPSTMTNANNIGISLTDIETYLGSDAKVVLDTILADAATRTESAGKKNSQRILSLIKEENGDENIIKYEKEIAANEKLAREILARVKTEEDLQRLSRTLKGIAMNNSELLLQEGKSKPILTPFFSIAAKSLAKESPLKFFRKKIYEQAWGKDYIDLAAKGVIETDQLEILKLALRVPELSKYVDVVCDRIAVNPDPEVFNDFFNNYVYKPWARPAIEKKIKMTGEDGILPNNLLSFIMSIERLKTNFQRENPSLKPYFSASSGYYADEFPGWLAKYKFIGAKSFAAVSPIEYIFEKDTNLLSEEEHQECMLIAAEKASEKEFERFVGARDSLKNILGDALFEKYFPIAIKNFINKNPTQFIDDYFGLAWTKDYISLAAEKIIYDDDRASDVPGSYIFLYYYGDQSSDVLDPLLDLAAKVLIQKRPELFTVQLDDMGRVDFLRSGQPWFENNCDFAAKTLAEKNPEYFLSLSPRGLPCYSKWIDFAREKMAGKTSTATANARILRLAKVLNNLGLRESDLVLKLKVK